MLRYCHVPLFAMPRTVAHQALLSMGFSWQEYWSGLPCPPPGDLPNPGIKLASLTFPALAGSFFTTSTTWEAQSGSPNSSQFLTISIVQSSLIQLLSQNSPSHTTSTISFLHTTPEFKTSALNSHPYSNTFSLSA